MWCSWVRLLVVMLFVELLVRGILLIFCFAVLCIIFVSDSFVLFRCSFFT